jgi:hypothetical protein
MDARTTIRRFPRALRAAIFAVLDGARRPAAKTVDDEVVMQSEEERIRQEVQRRKERAKRSGIITSTFGLYKDTLHYSDTESRSCPHPQITVTKKTETRDRSGDCERIEATIQGHSYIFTFRESTTVMPDGEPFTTGDLGVDFQGRRVMTIDCGCEDERYVGRAWYARDVSAFIEGPWVDELNFVFAYLTAMREERAKESREEAKKRDLEKLKRNFGL